MKVLIGVAQVPFARRPAERLATELRARLRRRGDRAEIVAIPFSWRTREQVVDHVVASRLMDWTGVDGSLADLLVALEFPAYLIPHPRKVLWLAHDHSWPGADPGSAALDDGSSPRDRLRRWTRDADREFLPEMQSLFAASTTVAASLKARTGLDPLPLYPPPSDPGRFAWQRAEDFALAPAGLSPARAALALEALALSSTPLRLKLCGSYDPPAEERLRATAGQLGLDDRLEWLGEVSEAEEARLYATSCLVLHPALEESLPWVALHAGLASKALVVCADSGAPAELVRHGESGAIVAPEPAALAGALDECWSDPQRALAWGRAGRAVAESSVFDWPHVLEALLEPRLPTLSRESRR